MLILGISSAYHEPAACIVRDGKIVCAVEEERFNRVRHGKPANLLNPDQIPLQSIKACLRQAGARGSEIDAVGLAFVPRLRLEHNVGLSEEVEPGGAGTIEGEEHFVRLFDAVPDRLCEALEFDVRDRIHTLEHHLCHAASAFFPSPFRDAAVMSVDGIGEATCTWLGTADNDGLTPLSEFKYPNSIGLMWTKVSRYLGFGEYGQWKVMGLAGYGRPERFAAAFERLMTFRSEGQFGTNSALLEIRSRRFDGLESLFGPRRLKTDPIIDRHADIAAALQAHTTRLILSLAEYLKTRSESSHLCYAGGVALNCVTNRVLVEKGPFDRVFIQPAANDAGTALGAAYLLEQFCGPAANRQTMNNAFLGPDEGIGGVDDLLRTGWRLVARGEEAMLSAARSIADGEIVAWFDGRMEFGPRALGHRSFLADPRRSTIVHDLNDKVKHREFFRPFGASVLEEQVDTWFQRPRPTPSDNFMLVARIVQPYRLGLIPAVTHVDNTCRIQVVTRESDARYHKLLTVFAELTGVPLVLNTSLNDNEPIVRNVEDLALTCARSAIRNIFVTYSMYERVDPNS